MLNPHLESEETPWDKEILPPAPQAPVQEESRRTGTLFLMVHFRLWRDSEGQYFIETTNLKEQVRAHGKTPMEARLELDRMLVKTFNVEK